MKRKKRLYIEPCAGLGNRLYALASALYYYDECGFNQLIIVWKKEPPFSADFYKIFDVDSLPKFRIVNLWQMGFRSGRLAYHLLSSLYIKIQRNGNKKVCLQEFLKDNVYDYDEIKTFLDQKDKCYIGSFSAFVDNSVLTSYLRKIRFNKELEKASLLNIKDEKKTIGVQIRRTDHKDAIERSPIELFIKRIDDLLENNSYQYVYLATDDNTVRNVIKDRYKEKLLNRHCISDTISRTTDDGIQDAVIDMLSLARCNMLLLSYSSTFGMCAAMIGGNMYEVIDNKQLYQQRDIYTQ